MNGSTMFVVADKGLDCKGYHDPGGSVTWENCTLRDWLNNDFYGTAFSSGEQGAIVSQTVVNEDNPVYNTEGGNNTADKVYLLSLSEVMNPDYGFCEGYDICSVSRMVKASDYAHARGAWAETGTDYADYADYAGNCFWWLRSPGYDTSCAADVTTFGSVYRSGYDVNDDYVACVPVLYINLSSGRWSMADDGTSGEGGRTCSYRRRNAAKKSLRITKTHPPTVKRSERNWRKQSLTGKRRLMRQRTRTE